MASIEKIDMDYWEGYQFLEWAESHEKQAKKQTGFSLLDGVHECDNGFVFNYPKELDEYVQDKCPLEFVTIQIKDKYEMMGIVLNAISGKPNVTELLEGL